MTDRIADNQPTYFYSSDKLKLPGHAGLLDIEIRIDLASAPPPYGEWVARPFGRYVVRTRFRT